MSDVDERLRFIFAGDSIVSDWHNPGATTSRAVMTALVELGHEATYLEPRRSPAMLDLLRARGAGPMRAFLSAYPKLQYRSVDLPATYEVVSWAGQFLSTASAAIGLAGCPPLVLKGFGEFQELDVRLFVERLDGEGDSVLLAEGDDARSMPFQPAVLPTEWDLPRAGTVVVAYDDAPLARQVADTFPDAQRIVSGSAELPDWEFVPEVELPARYGAAERVLVVDGSLAPVRVWLARANGARAWGVVNQLREQSQVFTGIESVNDIDWTVATPLPEALDARLTAAQLVTMTVERKGSAKR